jgi:hypothetical protein
MMRQGSRMFVQIVTRKTASLCKVPYERYAPQTVLRKRKDLMIFKGGKYMRLVNEDDTIHTKSSNPISQCAFPPLE